MKNNLLFFFVITSISCLIISANNNPANSQEQPNKPRIIYPLPDAAYQHIHDLYKNEFSTANTEFIMFLQTRYKKNKLEKNLEEEDKLITTLCKNFTENKKLKEKDLPFGAFAACVEWLTFHQLIADTRSYPNNYLLAPFEQQYQFKLYPTEFYNFLKLKNSLSAAQDVLYKQTALRNFAKFLLIKLSRR